MIDKSDGAGFKWYGTSVKIPYATKVCYRSKPSGNHYTSRQTQDGTGYKGAVNVDGTQCFTVTQGNSWTTGGIEAYENECSGAPNGTCEQLYYRKSCVNRTDIVVAAGLPAQCLNIQAFDTNWVKITDLSTLKAGDKVRFTVAGQTSSGSFDRARFIINGTTRPEVTAKRPNTQEFYDEYTIPTGITTFSVNAQLHHTTLGWF